MNAARHIPSPEDGGKSSASSAPMMDGSPMGEDEVDLFDYIEILVKRRWLIFCGVVICALSTSAVFLKMAPTYTAIATLQLREENVTEINLANTSQGASRSSGLFYVNALGSAPLNRAVLEKEYHYQRGEKDSTSQTLIEYFKARTLSQAVETLLGIAEFKTEKSGVIAISVTTPYSELSAQVANEYMNQLMAYDQKRRPSRVRFIEQRLEEVRVELSKAEETLLNFQKSNVNLIGGPGGGAPDLIQRGGPVGGSPDLFLELSRLQREVNVKSGLFTTLVNQYEVARIEARGQMPVIEVLNYADSKLCVISKKSGQSVLISASIGLIGTVFLAFFLEYIEKNRQTGRIDRLKEILQEDRKRFRWVFGKL